MHVWLLLLLIKSVPSETNLWTLACLVKLIFTSNILLNCKSKFECGAEDDSSSKLYLFLPLLNLAQIFSWISIKRGIKVWAKKHFLS